MHENSSLWKKQSWKKEEEREKKKLVLRNLRELSCVASFYSRPPLAIMTDQCLFVLGPGQKNERKEWKNPFGTKDQPRFFVGLSDCMLGSSYNEGCLPFFSYRSD